MMHEVRVYEIPRAYHFYTECSAHTSCLLKSPGEVEESGSQGRLEHDENRTQGAETRCFGASRRLVQQADAADALARQFLHAVSRSAALHDRRGVYRGGTQPDGHATGDTEAARDLILRAMS